MIPTSSTLYMSTYTYSALACIGNNIVIINTIIFVDMDCLLHTPFHVNREMVDGYGCIIWLRLWSTLLWDLKAFKSR